jgi:hypothetical protein
MGTWRIRARLRQRMGRVVILVSLLHVSSAYQLDWTRARGEEMVGLNGAVQLLRSVPECPPSRPRGTGGYRHERPRRKRRVSSASRRAARPMIGPRADATSFAPAVVGRFPSPVRRPFHAGAEGVLGKRLPGGARACVHRGRTGQAVARASLGGGNLRAQTADGQRSHIDSSEQLLLSPCHCHWRETGEQASALRGGQAPGCPHPGTDGWTGVGRAEATGETCDRNGKPSARFRRS